MKKIENSSVDDKNDKIRVPKVSTLKKKKSLLLLM